MTRDKAPDLALTDKQAAELGEKLLRFRDGLPKNQRRVLNKLIGGTIAADNFIKRPYPDDKKAESFSQALTTFENGLQQGQREGFRTMLAAGALAWGLAPEPTPEDDIKPISMIWVHVARTAAVILAGFITVVREGMDDDEEIIVPDIDLPDNPH